MIVLIGIGLAAATVMLHGIGTVFWIKFMQKTYGSQPTLEGNESPEFGTARTIWVLCTTTVMLVALHVAEVSIWALAYLNLPDLVRPKGMEEAFYFSMVTLTSLGYGDVVISGPWRMLSGIEAMSGMLVFGWSSALLLAVFMRLLELSPKKLTRSG